jgi:valyl-tRNA synthetase
MRVELASRYDPKQVEDRIYEFWLEGGFFHTEPDRPGEAYTIVIPPPNVTGALHMGHALNGTLQDIFVRWRRMQGCNVLWLPGTDHAGIATQNVVEQELAREGVRRDELGREKFVERVWQWKEQYGDRIIKQLKRLGSSCDWDRQRFTMDEGLSRAVRETFVSLYERGLIYRGHYIINWCPRDRTALSDDEVEHEEHEGHLWYIRYSFKDDPCQYISVATTRPETMLGDMAVAVHPEDGRYRHLVGRTLILPVIGREIPIIADDWVDPSFGTGAVKVTPAHDPNDFDIGKRHDLPAVVVIDEDAHMTREAGEMYEGMDRLECREALLEDLRERDELERTETHTHSVGHCYRCHTVIEPRLSEQWFVRMRPLADKAVQATREGRVRFHPERWTAFYLSWLENVRDWCISRQIWWGHRIPVYYCDACGGTIVARERPERCGCGADGLRQDEDVLDTWFSSALWPFSTLGWPEQTADLERYYPTSTLVTGRGIIYFWVARMVMMGEAFMGREPFGDVVINATVQDELGRKMSKSLGNGIDPIDMIEAFGADAIRFSLTMLTSEGQDARLTESKFEMGRNFANKIWNALRFTLTNLGAGDDGDGPRSGPEELAAARTLEDRWILSRTRACAGAVTQALDDFRINDAAQGVYDFFWHDLCDWYVESAKFRLGENPDALDRAVARETLARVLDASLRLLHPFMPFLTEDLWAHLKAVATGAGLAAADAMRADALVVSDWPEADDALRDEQLESDMALLRGLIRAVRNLRREKSLRDDQPLRVTVSCADERTQAVLERHGDLLRKIAVLEQLDHGIGQGKPVHAATTVVGSTQVFVRLEGLIDLDEERARLEKQRLDVTDHLGKVEQQLQNPDFVANAPEDVVRRQMDRANELRERLEKIMQNMADLE